MNSRIRTLEMSGRNNNDPAPSRNLAGSQHHIAVHRRPEGHKMINNKHFFPMGQKHTAENSVCQNFWLVTSNSAGRYNSALRSQVTPSAEFNIAVQYLGTIWCSPLNWCMLPVNRHVDNLDTCSELNGPSMRFRVQLGNSIG
jgi:hypothetical protein